MQRLILLGPPGAGKGTIAAFMTARLGIPQISTGDMLRAAIQAGSPLGKEAKSVMDAGGLVSDHTILGLVAERLKNPDCQRGYLFDGFPRTVPQAQALWDQAVRIDRVLDIEVPEADILERMSGRWFHPASGRSYHIRFNPPKTAGHDDVSGEPLVQRQDDRPETVLERLRVYREQTEPVRHFYQSLAQGGHANAPRFITLSGLGSVESVRQRILDALA